MSWRQRASGVVLVTFSSICIAGNAVSRNLGEDDLTHIVVSDDTLSGIAFLYFGSSRNWGSIYRANSLLNPHMLQVGQVLRLPGRLVKRQDLKLNVVGAKGAELGAGSARHTLKEGDVLGKGATVLVRGEGFAQLQFDDGSRIRLGPESEVNLKEIAEIGPLKAQRIEIQIRRGRLDSWVKPQPRDGMFRVSTPTAVAAVRGTEFGVTATNVRETAVDVVEGSVAVSQTGKPTQQLLEHSQGMVIGSTGARLVVQSLAEAPRLPMLHHLVEANDYRLSLASLNGGQYEAVVYSAGANSQALHLATSESGELTIPGLPAGTYSMSVRAISKSGLASLPSLARMNVVARPEPPILTEPVDGDEFSVAKDIELACTDVSSAQDYIFQVSSQPSFERNTETFARSVCHLVLPQHGVGTAYWRVASRAKLDGEQMLQGPYSGIRRFDVAPIPNPPELVVNAAGTVTVSWPRLAGHTYRLEVALDHSFSDATMYPDTGSPVVKLAPSPCADRYLRIRATDRHGVDSPLSAVHTVRKSPWLCSSHALPVLDSNGDLVESGRAIDERPAMFKARPPAGTSVSRNADTEGHATE